MASKGRFQPSTARPTGFCSPPPDFSRSTVRFPIRRPDSLDSLTRRTVRAAVSTSSPRISATRITGISTPSSWASGSSPHSPPTIAASRSRILSIRQLTGVFPKILALSAIGTVPITFLPPFPRVPHPRVASRSAASLSVPPAIATAIHRRRRRWGWPWCAGHTRLPHRPFRRRG